MQIIQFFNFVDGTFLLYVIIIVVVVVVVAACICGDVVSVSRTICVL